MVVDVTYRWRKRPMSDRDHVGAVLGVALLVLLGIGLAVTVTWIGWSGLLDGRDLFPGVDMIPGF